MLEQTIIHYLESHKRLVIPLLGTFIVKAPGQIILSEMLKRDDGILRDLLTAQGISQLEAAGAISRFVFEIRHTIEHRGEYTVANFGIFSAGPNQTILFRPISSPAPSRPLNAEAARQQIKEALQHPSANKTRKETDPYFAKDPDLKGLRYGKPVKTTDAYTYVNSAPSHRPDKFVVLAIIAVILAVATITYGYMQQDKSEATTQEQQQIEQPIDSLDNAIVKENPVKKSSEQKSEKPKNTK